MILVRYGEIGLKRKLRKKFEDILIANIQSFLDFRGIKEDIFNEWGRIYVQSFDVEIARLLAGVFGVTSTSVAVETDPEMERIKDKALEIGINYIDSSKSFAIRARRAGKHDFSSMDVQRVVGAEMERQTGGKVDLGHPDVNVYIEVRENTSFIYTSIIQGFGGLPVGSQERVLSVIHDKTSVVSTWYALRRGCDVDLLVSEKMGQLDRIEDILLPWGNYRDMAVHKGPNDLEELLSTAFDMRYPAVYCSSTMSEIEPLLPLLRDRNMPVLTPLLSFDVDGIERKIELIENYFNSGSSRSFCNESC